MSVTNLLGKRPRIDDEQQPDSSSFKLSRYNYLRDPSKLLAETSILRDPSQLPAEIVMLILLSLSTEDLLNLRLVSKFWFNLISSPSFVNDHLKHQPKQLLVSAITKPTHINKNYVYRHFSLTGINNEEEEDLVTIKELKLQLPSSHVDDFSSKILAMQASCDGLVLLQNVYDPRQLYISNPVTNPSSFLHLPILDPGCECSNWVLFLDTSINRYRVFGIRCQGQFLVLTLGENVLKPLPHDVDWSVWTMLKQWLGLYVYILSQILVVKNELHWLSILPISHSQARPSQPGRYCVFSVNAETIHFSKVKVPLRLANPGNPHEFKSRKRLHLLLEVNGLLCLTIVSRHLLEMYVLNDRRKCVWTKSHTISLELMPNRPAFLGSFLLDNVCLVAVRGVDGNYPLDILKVIIHDEDDLLLFNLMTQKIRDIGYLSKDQKLCTPYFIYFSTLVGYQNQRGIRKC